MALSNENKKEIFVNNITNEVRKTNKSEWNGGLIEDIHKTILENKYFVELEDKNTKKVTVVDFYTNQGVENFLDVKNGIKPKKKELKNIDFENTDIRIHRLSDETIKKLASDITDLKFSSNSANETEVQLKKMIGNAFENSSEIIEINKEKNDKANKFTNALSKFEDVFSDYSKKYTSNFEKINDYKQYSVTFNPENKPETIVAKDLETFRNNVVDFLKDKVDDNKLLKELKETNLEDLKPKIDKNFKFTFGNLKDNNYSLKIETEEKVLTLNESKELKEIALNLTDKDYSNLLNSYERISKYDKLEYLKEENKELFKKLDENISKETLENIENDITYRSILNVVDKNDVINRNYDKIYSKDKIFSDMKEEIDVLFENRIGNLKDNEKIALVERSADELGISLNSQGKIDELYTGDDKEYLNNVNQLLENEKEKIFHNYVENFEEIKKIKSKGDVDLNSNDEKLKKDKDTYYNEKTFYHLKTFSSLVLKNETLDIQEEILKNSVLIFTTPKFDKEEDVDAFQYGKQTKEVKALKKEIYNEIKEYFKENTETLKDMPNEKYSQKAFSSLSSLAFYDFDKERKMELSDFSPKKTKEKADNNSKEKEIEL